MSDFNYDGGYDPYENQWQKETEDKDELSELIAEIGPEEMKKIIAELEDDWDEDEEFEEDEDSQPEYPEPEILNEPEEPDYNEPDLYGSWDDEIYQQGHDHY